MEIRLKKPRKIRQCFVKECETLADLSRPALLEKIVQLVADLGLDQPIQSNRLVVREMLGEHYKPGTVARLTDFWECRRTHSLAQMQDGLHYQLRTIQRYEKQLAAAGVSPTANPGNVVLPALSELIADDLRMDNEERKDQELSQTPSATRSFEVFNMRQGDLPARQGRSGFPETHEIPVHLKPWIDHAGRTGSPNHVLNDEGDPASAAGPRSTAAWRHRLVRSSPEVLPSPQGPIEWVGGEIDNREVPQPGPAPPGPRLQIRRSVYCITSS
jgi:hypothetical protein